MLPGGRAQIGTALDGWVAEHGDRLSLVRAGGWDFQVPRLSQAIGDKARLFILARDVMLALEPPQRISARNVLVGRIAAVMSEADRVLVRVSCAGGDLLSAVTPDAAVELQLRPGLTVWAVVKSVAIDGLGGGLLDALDS